jgi:hypothetical protein
LCKRTRPSERLGTFCHIVEAGSGRSGAIWTTRCRPKSNSRVWSLGCHETTKMTELGAMDSWHFRPPKAWVRASIFYGVPYDLAAAVSNLCSTDRGGIRVGPGAAPRGRRFWSVARASCPPPALKGAFNKGLGATPDHTPTSSIFSRFLAKLGPARLLGPIKVSNRFERICSLLDQNSGHCVTVTRRHERSKPLPDPRRNRFFILQIEAGIRHKEGRYLAPMMSDHHDAQ